MKKILVSAIGLLIVLGSIQVWISVNCIETERELGLFSCLDVDDIQLQSVEKQHLLILTDTEEILVNVEIVDTPQERSRGLMFREHLDQDSGMFFVFERQDILAFWMKNTLIPLDMLFIDENFEIVEIKKSVPPCFEEPCPNYPTKKPAKYVLEVNEGFVERNNIKVSDKILYNTE